MTSPGVPREKMCRPRSYVVWHDLAALGRGIVQAFEGELRQWGRRDELGPTALAIAAVLLVFRGLRGGPWGCGVQAPIEAWCRLLGKSERQVQYAFAQLEAAGWARRQRRLLRHQWTDEQGRQHQRADVHAVAYLLTKGAVRLSRRGETRKLMVLDGRERRVLVAWGLVGKLLSVTAEKLRVVALRVTDAPADCTPSYGVKTHQLLQAVEGGSPVGNAGARSRVRALPADGPPGGRRAQGRPPDTWRGRPQGEGVRRPSWVEPNWELEAQLYTPQGFGPWTMWREHWRGAGARTRSWLCREFARAVKEAGGLEQLEAQWRRENP